MVPYKVMYLGGCLGDAIIYFDDTHEKIYGFKDPITNSFRDGSVLFDIVNHLYEESIPLYLITKTKRCRDPRDMFFADIFLIGRVKNPHHYEENWYKPYIKDLLQEYEKKLRNPFLTHRRRIKQIVLVLKLMSE